MILDQCMPRLARSSHVSEFVSAFCKGSFNTAIMVTNQLSPSKFDAKTYYCISLYCC